MAAFIQLNRLHTRNRESAEHRGQEREGIAAGLQSTLLGTPVQRRIHVIIQSANRVAAVQLIKSRFLRLKHIFEAYLQFSSESTLWIEWIGTVM